MRTVVPYQLLSLDGVAEELRAGLVDELQLVVAPTIAGKGARLFDSDGDLRRLDLREATRTPAGLLLLGYRVPPVG